ncbi:DUF6869 domain-containing protein [Methylobacterium sp. SI9]|uniref:DUF6869 domain-containing protein n=1 Tax=Methylobacterium guangdongense TaxID=3138811 RepID=UPI00313DBA0D
MDHDHDQEWAENWSRRSNEEIAATWIDFQGRLHVSPERMGEDRSWWAVDAIMGLSEDNPFRALEICFAVARLSNDPKVLGALGAGPLEDIISENPNVIDVVSQEATSNENLITALGSMWQSTIPDDVWSVLQKIMAKS